MKITFKLTYSDYEVSSVSYWDKLNDIQDIHNLYKGVYGKFDKSYTIYWVDTDLYKSSTFSEHISLYLKEAKQLIRNQVISKLI